MIAGKDIIILSGNRNILRSFQMKYMYLTATKTPIISNSFLHEQKGTQQCSYFPSFFPLCAVPCVTFQLKTIMFKQTLWVLETVKSSLLYFYSRRKSFTASCPLVGVVYTELGHVQFQMYAPCDWELRQNHKFPTDEERALCRSWARDCNSRLDPGRFLGIFGLVSLSLLATSSLPTV